MKIPERLACRPKDWQGRPVPWFVQWFDQARKPCGELDNGAWPDFRVVNARRLGAILRGDARCWICGEKLGVHRIFVIGPMCVVNRLNSEPPSHRECAEYAARVCPFLTRPRQKRDKKDLPEDWFAPGLMIDRNPGVTALYETGKYSPFRAGDGVLFRLGPPVRVDWFKEGRPATREEVFAALDTGYPTLLALAEKDGEAAVRELQKMRADMEKLTPAA